MGKGCALLMEMGCGKSITTVAVAGRAYLNGLIRKLLIIAPKSILPVWQEEFSKFADFYYTITVLQGSSEKKKEQLHNIKNEGLQVVVVNYDSVSLIENALLAWKADFLVCDESTRIKNPEAKSSQAVHKLARQCRYKMILTGSPVTQNPLDLFSQYKVIDENIFGNSFAAFRNRYAILGSYNQPVGYRNLPELVKKAHSVAYRITKEQALDLPETIDEIYPVNLEDKAKRVYNQYVEKTYRRMEEEGDNTTGILAALMKLQQITGGFYRQWSEEEACIQISEAKLQALEDLIQTNVQTGEKLVVMARFIPEIKAIESMLQKKKIKYAIIHGEVKDRSGEVRKFQEDPECKVFLGQLQTTSMGITLTAASTMVFYSLSYNYADYIQSKARIHRIGQKKSCIYIHLVAKGTVDEAVLNSLQRKEDIARKIVDNWKAVIQ